MGKGGMEGKRRPTLDRMATREDEPREPGPVSGLTIGPRRADPVLSGYSSPRFLHEIAGMSSLKQSV